MIIADTTEYLHNSDIPLGNINIVSDISTDQIGISKAWGVTRQVFPDILKKIQKFGDLKRKLGSGAPITVMTTAVKNKLVKILIENNGDLDFKSWEDEIAKDKRFRLTPKQETIRRWWKNECGGIYVSKKSRPMISEHTTR